MGVLPPEMNSLSDSVLRACPLPRLRAGETRVGVLSKAAGGAAEMDALSRSTSLVTCPEANMPGVILFRPPLPVVRGVKPLSLHVPVGPCTLGRS